MTFSGKRRQDGHRHGRRIRHRGGVLPRAVRGGAEVVCTDVDGDAAARTADPLGAPVARLDVTDAAAVQACVDEVVDARAGST